LRTTFRRRIAAFPEILDQLLEGVVRAGRYETYWHRVEKGDWAQHLGLPRRAEHWQTLQAWVVRKTFLPSARGLANASFAHRVARIFTELYPLYTFSSVPSAQWQAQLKKSLMHARPR
jgi:hypothetical protein